MPVSAINPSHQKQQCNLALQDKGGFFVFFFLLLLFTEFDIKVHNNKIDLASKAPTSYFPKCQQNRHSLLPQHNKNPEQE